MLVGCGWRASGRVGDWSRWVLGDPVAFVLRLSAHGNLGRRAGRLASCRGQGVLL